jgi:hypothetical protein
MSPARLPKKPCRAGPSSLPSSCSDSRGTTAIRVLVRRVHWASKPKMAASCTNTSEVPVERERRRGGRRHLQAGRVAQVQAGDLPPELQPRVHRLGLGQPGLDAGGQVRQHGQHPAADRRPQRQVHVQRGALEHAREPGHQHLASQRVHDLIVGEQGGEHHPCCREGAGQRRPREAAPHLPDPGCHPLGVRRAALLALQHPQGSVTVSGTEITSRPG